MKKTTRKLSLLIVAAVFLILITASSAIAQNTTKAKPGDNCDKIIMKSGKTLIVDITRIDTSKIYYVKCDSLEPQFTVLKSQVQSVKYATDNTVYNNDETYGKVNTNSFGWNNYELMYNEEKLTSAENQAKDKNKTTLYDRPMGRSQLKKLYQGCPEAMSQLKASGTFSIIGLVLIGGGCGYLALSYNKVSKQRENDYTEWWNNQLNTNTPGVFDNHKYFIKKQTNAIIGLGVTTVGLIFISAAANHFNHSVTIYNEKHSTASNTPVQYNLQLTSTGLGISMRF